MTFRTGRWCVAAAALALVALGCDDKNELPPEVIQAQQKQERDKFPVKPLPTTRELTSEAKRWVRMGDFPVALEAPKSWALKSTGLDGEFITLTGNATSGEVNILLNQRKLDPIPLARLDASLEDMRKQSQAKPHPVNRVQKRALGPVIVLEQRMISNEFVGGKLPPEQWGDSYIEDSKGNKLTDASGKILTTRAITNPHMLRWTFVIFVPTEKPGYYMQRGSLTFQSLKLSEYTQDQEFLEKLMESLRHEE